MAKATKIFLVEDNIGDVRLIKNSLEEMGIDHCCTVASNGVEALEHLNEKEGQKFVNKHDLIILDLNLPKKSGLEVLKEIKSIPGLKHIPVVIFSSSDAPADVKKAYDCHANCYVIKPFDFDKYSESIKKIWDFWLTTAKLDEHDLH